MITLDGKSIEDFGFYVQPEYEDPITPQFERKTIAIPGRAGLWDFGSEIGTKSFSYPLKIYDRFHDRMQSTYNELVAFLFDDFGKPREIKLVREYEPDKFLTVKVVQSILPERPTEDGELDLPFVAYDPHKKLNVENNEIHWDSTTATYDDTWSIDTTFIDDTLITSNQTVETYVNGLAIRPDIHISGSGKNVAISANGKSFKLKDFTDAVFLIRGFDYTCFKNGVDNLTEMTGDHLLMMPGLNKVKITGSNMNFKLSIRLRDNYL